MNKFQFSIPTDVIFGCGSLNRLSKVGKRIGKKALLVTGKSSMRKTGILDRVVKLLNEGSVEVVVNEGVDPNPKTNYINDMVTLAKEEKCDFVIGLGGGSSMDAAKAIALVVANGGIIEDYLPGGERANMRGIKGALPIVAISTTAGTGSEVTMFSVITNPITKEKPGIGHRCLYPKVSIVDPELMVSVPKSITKNTGIDVLFHAIEAYISKGATPFTDMYAKEAISLVLNNLHKVLEDGTNIEAREKMAWANTLAGIAITHGGTIGIHGMGHPVSGHTNSAHGATLATLGVAFLEETWDGHIDRYASLTELLGFHTSNLSKEEAAAKSSVALKEVLNNIGATETLSDLGVTKDMIDPLVKDTFRTMIGCIKLTLKELNEEDLKRIYEKSL
ncbi:iron-containing alcohol dehydrogenase [Anaeromicrobium sediminis]|uniref:Uncharacterized protein n=1 Tax=Anaeromicrobium sediminis TaxID=1478221 RepID=A0A267MGC3_9FIRM|nr:iron-containing alcohol dehydrogenase [Anaeromicrobium sediminis]PAB58517.1 hypothetical protein CCE28_14520 [Anaeromicrobium sediminis]